MAGKRRLSCSTGINRPLESQHSFFSLGVQLAQEATTKISDLLNLERKQIISKYLLIRGGILHSVQSFITLFITELSRLHLGCRRHSSFHSLKGGNFPITLTEKTCIGGHGASQQGLVIVTMHALVYRTHSSGYKSKLGYSSIPSLAKATFPTPILILPLKHDYQHSSKPYCNEGCIKPVYIFP